ncbi:hypothetical protein SUGI_0572470 [Cryptomeria japonica]|nr:hypothetical protein SUGI_0572470 [Cryptomeria japonica]
MSFRASLRVPWMRMKLQRREGGLADIISCLRVDLIQNLGNMCNPQLHTPRLQVVLGRGCSCDLNIREWFSKG